MKEIDWQTVRRRRLARNYLLTPAAGAPVIEMVGAVGGIQAQVLSAAEIAIGVRLSGVTRQAVRDALWEKRQLVKTYGPRGTLHLLPAGELPLWMAAMQARAALLGQPWYARAGLTPEQAEALTGAIGQALDGKCLAREELADEVTRLAGGWARELMLSTWGEMLPPAAYTGMLCYGPSRGSKVTFVRADQWTGGWAEVDPQQALLAVLRRYLAAYGPITPQDFASWFWLKPAQVRLLLDQLADELVEVRVQGKPAWMMAQDVTDLEDHLPPGPLRLVPQYDCYVLGSNPREQIVPELARKHIFATGRGRFEGAAGLSVLLADGLVTGIWERHERKKQVELLVRSFIPLGKQQLDELDAEASRIGTFLNAPVTLSVHNLEN
jgi:uncharacterized protein YcaQ